MTKILNKVQAKWGVILCVMLLAVILVGCKSDDPFSKYDKATGEYYFRISAITAYEYEAVSENEKSYKKSYKFTFPYIYLATDKVCNDSAKFADCGAPTLSIDRGTATSVNSESFKFSGDGFSLTTLKADKNSYDIAYDAKGRVLSFEMKTDGNTVIRLDSGRIAKLGDITLSTEKSDLKKFGYVVGLNLLDTIEKKDGEEILVQKVKSIKTDTALLLETTSNAAPYDSLFCDIDASTWEEATYYAWGWDSLEIKSTKDTTIIASKVVVLDPKTKEPIKSKVDETADSMLITKKNTKLPSIIEEWNAADKEWKDIVLAPKIIKKKGTETDSAIVDTIMTVTYNSTSKKLDTAKVPNVLRAQVYQYNIIKRHLRPVLTTSVDFYTAYSKAVPVKYLQGVTVEKIEYKPKKGVGETDVKKTSKVEAQSDTSYAVEVEFESHVVTK